VPSCQSKNSDGKTQIGSYNTARSMLWQEEYTELSGNME
jgi:hypothetical protein